MTSTDARTLPDHLDALFVGGTWVAPAGSDTLDGGQPDHRGAARDRAGRHAGRRRPRRGRGPGGVPGLGRDPGGRAGRAARPRSPTGSRARVTELAELIAREIGSPLKFATLDPGRAAGRGAALLSPRSSATYGFEEEIGNSLVRARADRRRRRDHAVELPAAPGRGQGRRRAGRRLHGRAQAERGRAARRRTCSPSCATRSGCRPACSTSCRAPARSSARRSPPTRTSTWSRSPARRGPAGGCSEVAAGTVKRVALELGGKSANVILDDADLAKAVKVGVANCFINGGQTCTALDPDAGAGSAARRGGGAGRRRGREVHGRRPARRRDPARPDGLGGPAGPGPRLHREGRSPRARRSPPAARTRRGLERGFFVRPTVFADVAPESTIAQEEIFGPVLSVIPYADEDEAVEIANGTPYGLAGAVLVGRPRPRGRVRPAAAHRPGRRQRRRVQPARAVRRLQAVRHRPRAGPATAWRSSSRSSRCSCR